MSDPTSTATAELALTIRPRRLRASAGLRRMVRETELNAADFIYPLLSPTAVKCVIPSPPCPALPSFR
jgi:delta-aminolevulinic acid dehydratase/porphobilinogen synthase